MRNWRIGSGFLFLVLGIGMVACLEGESVLTPEKNLQQQLAKVDKTRLAADIAIIDDSLERWNLTSVVETEPQGVRYVIDVLGSGTKPSLGNTITVQYKGTLLSDGEEFDSSTNLVYPLYYLILGWQTTIPLLPVGTKATLYIPSGLAYGPYGVKDPNTSEVIIPPNANLIFEIELKAIQ